MKKIFSLVFVVIIIIIIFNLFFHSLEITNIISFSLELFIKNIFPSLFPMFVIANILVLIGIPNFLGKLFSKIMTKLFNVKGIASFVFFMSMLSGYPSNAKYLKELLEKNEIDEIDLNKILLFTTFGNPLFIINTIGILILNDLKLGFFILISHILGNITVGLIFRNTYKRKEKMESFNLKNELIILNKKINSTTIFKNFLSGINNSLLALLNILGIITCFLILTEIIKTTFNINPFLDSIITGILEFSSGIKKVSLLDTHLKLYIIVFFISFGGISVHAQILNILTNYKVKYDLFLFARILHGLLSVIYLYLLLQLG